MIQFLSKKLIFILTDRHHVKMYPLHASLRINVNGIEMEIPDPEPISHFDQSAFYIWLVIVFAIYAPKNTIFTNAEVENTTQLIMIKSNSDINRDGLMSDFENWDTNEIIMYSIFLDKSEKKEEAKVILYRSIIDNPTSDTLIKFYELMKSESKNLQVNVSKKLSISILNQWNEDEALQLLELMKKNEKHLL